LILKDIEVATQAEPFFCVDFKNIEELNETSIFIYGPIKRCFAESYDRVSIKPVSLATGTTKS
jgi:hypothetical protein